ncbi:MAG: HD domain-containing protein [Candidatus Limivivens sp.]|nr:HD domain-containing protein [Candidatus Limivivens sp.]
MKDSITTYTKKQFTPLDPREEDIDIRDIAHALSLMTRANGHFPEFYSVGQHSVACCQEAKARGCSGRVVLAALLHDASEAYLADITRPVKKSLTVYLEAERRVQEAVYRKYLGSLPTEEESAQVKAVDDDCLYHEFFHFMGEKLWEEEPRVWHEQDLRVRPFAEVEKQFLELFEELLVKSK